VVLSYSASNIRFLPKSPIQPGAKTPMSSLEIIILMKERESRIGWVMEFRRFIGLLGELLVNGLKKAEASYLAEAHIQR
jgi:hypothetical protein